MGGDVADLLVLLQQRPLCRQGNAAHRVGTGGLNSAIIINISEESHIDLGIQTMLQV